MVSSGASNVYVVQIRSTHLCVLKCVCVCVSYPTTKKKAIVSTCVSSVQKCGCFVWFELRLSVATYQLIYVTIRQILFCTVFLFFRSLDSNGAVCVTGGDDECGIEVWPSGAGRK